MGAGLTSDPLSGSKSGSGGSTAGQRTIANTLIKKTQHDVSPCFQRLTVEGGVIKT